MYLLKQIDREFSEAGGGRIETIDQTIYNSERSQTGGEDGEHQLEVLCCQARGGGCCRTAHTSFTVAEISVIAVADGSVTAWLSHVRTESRAGDGLLEPRRGLLLQRHLQTGLVLLN